ncbi:hypothetical protein BGX23_003311 [Mortierella sp. AD031]|nr:hypothetical protein BGX23_003311 [Mortierella sp. AD031]KAG0208778.1 hypothetical protein BGX33_006049 [Mortierella sp. NVP41]
MDQLNNEDKDGITNVSEDNDHAGDKDISSSKGQDGNGAEIGRVDKAQVSDTIGEQDEGSDREFVSAVYEGNDPASNVSSSEVVTWRLVLPVDRPIVHFVTLKDGSRLAMVLTLWRNGVTFSVSRPQDVNKDYSKQVRYRVGLCAGKLHCGDFETMGVLTHSTVHIVTRDVLWKRWIPLDRRLTVRVEFLPEGYDNLYDDPSDTDPCTQS